jgi:hypothetical protein
VAHSIITLRYIPRTLGGPGAIRETRNGSAWKHCPENLHGNLCCVSGCFKHNCVWLRSAMEAPLSGQAGFQIVKTVRCFWRTWPALWPDLVVPLWGYVTSKAHGTRPANTDDLKQGILECLQGNTEEMLQRVTVSFPTRMQECIERHGGYIQSVILKQ